jgi:CheY-like chemotaxis protein
MSAVDGYEFIQRVRLMNSAVRNVPAIALTAYASEEDRQNSREAGFNAHLSKPIALNELIHTASKLIAEHG